MLYLQIVHEGIGQSHIAGIRGQDEIAQLHAIRRYRIAQDIMIFTQQLREIMQDHEQDAKRPLQTRNQSFKIQNALPYLVHHRDRLGQFDIPQEWREEFEMIDNQLRVHRSGLQRFRTVA